MRSYTLCLNMIVKNESHIIETTLTTLLKYIKFDYWVICDTGSTDNTIQIIKNFFAKHSIDGKIYETPWKNFGFNRTDAFEKAYNLTDYVFVWDADDSITGNFSLPDTLTNDSYRFIFGNSTGFRYTRCQLFNNKKKWKYVGVLHEYPACIDKCDPAVDISGDYYFISGRTGARNHDPNKYLRDAEILEKGFEEAFEAKDPIFNRYAFYCAQSYNSAGIKDKAIQWYTKVLSLDNWNQEKYISCLEIYYLCEDQNKINDGLPYLVESYKYDKHRIECFYRLIKYYCIKGIPEISNMYYGQIKNYFENLYGVESQGEKLFVKQSEYVFYLPYYMIIVGDRLKERKTCAKMYEIIFKYKFLEVGEWWIHNLFHNIQFCINELPLTTQFIENMFEYIKLLRIRKIILKDSHNEIITKIVEKYRPIFSNPSSETSQICPLNKTNDQVKILFSITTCKRLDLFKKTVYSILNNWLDINKVDYFLCVDDNSSEEDISEMKTLFPFFNYYLKTPEEKGHRESMNIIWSKLNEIKPTFWIHMEDDWMFFQKKNYITDGIEFLNKYHNDNNKMNQIVFNKNYGLMYSDLGRVGGIQLENDLILHEKRDGLVGRNCGYWPHYSLQPSIIHTKVILELGNYNSTNKFFERDYAEKYNKAGYKTGFFPSIYSLHIGKQHWEKDGQNAYALNGTAQFNPKSSPTTILTNSISSSMSMKDSLTFIIEKIKSKTSFGLIRPSDGEYKILQNETLTNCDNWTFNSGGILQKHLLEAVSTIDKNLFIGIPCNTCNKPWNCTDKIYNDYINLYKVPIEQRTYANIFGNSNWKTFIEFIKSYEEKIYLITSGTSISTSTFKIFETFEIDKYLVNNWDTVWETETKRLLDFISEGNLNNQLILFSAGPISKVWIPMCMKKNPNNMYVDVGGAIDILTKGTTSRLYIDDNHPFAKESCNFK